MTTTFSWKGKVVKQTAVIDQARAVIGEQWTIDLPSSELEFLHGDTGPNVSTAETIEPDPSDPKRSICTSVQQFDNGPQIKFEQLVKSAHDGTSDIEIDGPVEDQLAVRSMLHYLRTSISPSGNMAISPFGLSNDLYYGHVFWDADIWVFPALALLEPDRAARIPAYRWRTREQAMRNAEAWVKSGRPTGGKPLGAISSMIMTGAKYAWESSVSGKETVPGPSKFEDHITGDVAWSMDLAASLGLAPESQADAIRKAANTFFSLRRTNGKDGLFSIPDTMSPDENHIGDDDLYTNLLAQYVATGGRVWGDPIYHLPKDNQSFLTYEGDPLRGYKQAAAVLSIYPLQYPPAEAQAKVMMDRFADKVTKNGPAMSDAIHALIWARLGESDKAYAIWRDSWQPFTTSPLMLFGEKRSRARTYFTTGAGGCLQTVLYGFLGVRIDTKKLPGSQWSTPLENGRIVSIKPNLPKAWNRITVRGLSILGQRYDVVADQKSVQVTRQQSGVRE